MKITYVGPHDEVEVPTLNVTVKRDYAVNVDDEIALEMIKQADWVSAPTRVSTKTKD